MRRIVGIDEAGYGPNLGPFVMAAVRCDAESECTDLWQLLRRAVRRSDGYSDGRLIVDDSKNVYSPRKGLKQLERTVLAVFPRLGQAWSLGELLGILEIRFAAESDLARCCPLTLELPVAADRGDIERSAVRFASECRDRGLNWLTPQCRVVDAATFNAIVNATGTKSAVSAEAIRDLCLRATAGAGAVTIKEIVIDKQGGRNNYRALLEEMGIAVEVECEGQESSRYRSRDGRCSFEFRVAADRCSMPVALASMLAKYVRELLMIEWNRFWQSRLQNLDGTAGYPRDALRFWKRIAPVAEKLGIAKSAIWRVR